MAVLDKGAGRAAWKHPVTSLPGVLRLRDRLPPGNSLAALGFSDGDMGHAVVGRGTMPVTGVRRNPDSVARSDLLSRAAFLLHVSGACGDDQHLPQRVGVPSCACAGLEGHCAAADARRRFTFEQAINAHRAGKVLRRALDLGLRAVWRNADFAGGLGFSRHQ